MACLLPNEPSALIFVYSQDSVNEASTCLMTAFTYSNEPHLLPLVESKWYPGTLLHCHARLLALILRQTSDHLRSHAFQYNRSRSACWSRFETRAVEQLIAQDQCQLGGYVPSEHFNKHFDRKHRPLVEGSSSPCSRRL